MLPTPHDTLVVVYRLVRYVNAAELVELKDERVAGIGVALLGGRSERDEEALDHGRHIGCLGTERQQRTLVNIE